MGAETFAERLAGLIAPAKSERAFAKEIGISPAGLRGLLHHGNSPTLETLVAIARARGVSVGWLAAGEGDRLPGGSPAGGSGLLDAELLGRVVDRVARIYREEGVRLQDVELGRIAAERYAEIIEFSEDPDERFGFVEVVAARVRKAIRAAAADPANLKREA